MKNSDMPAMPHTEYDKDGNLPAGMTKREYFVARAMHGICGHANAHTMAPDAIARRAMSVANTVLAALEKEQAK